MKRSIQFFIPAFLLIAIVFLLTSCSTGKYQSAPVYTKYQNQWQALADSLQNKLQSAYLSAHGKYYVQNNMGNNTFHYWHNAHVMDILADAHARTKNKIYIRRMENLLQGIKHTNPINRNSYINDYYDDMAWLGLASLNGYVQSGNKAFLDAAKILWKDILTGINNYDGRSLSWSKSTPKFKNTPANGPAIIMGLRLYKITQTAAYKDTAVMMYDWLRQTLTEPSGILTDGIKEGKPENAIYTYNQGLFMGAALEMYHLTQDRKYLNDALKTAKASMSDPRISRNNILKPEGQGDGGLFKGIFIRYFSNLIKCKDIDESDRKLFIDFIMKNAQSVYAKATDHQALLINFNWEQMPGKTIDLSTQLSGMMLAEAVAELAQLHLVK